MRRAFNDYGWLTLDGDNSSFEGRPENPNSVIGFSLGYDFCAEHEFGAKHIKRKLGIPDKAFPVGIEDRIVSTAESLEFHPYKVKLPVPGAGKKTETVPAALMFLDLYKGREKEVGPKELVNNYGVAFLCDPSFRSYDPSRHDIASSWSEGSGFAINVRGKQNVDLLKNLYDAFQEGRVAILDPSVMGFLRAPLCFVQPDLTPAHLLNQLRTADEENLRLYQAFEATGVKADLEAAGRRAYALSPSWRNEKTGDLLVFLNPAEQKKYQHGWFTIDELRQWAKDEGPIVRQLDVEEMLKTEYPDFAYRLSLGLSEIGVSTMAGPPAVRMPDGKPGVRLIITKSIENSQFKKDGYYSIEELAPIYEMGAESDHKRSLAKKTVRP